MTQDFKNSVQTVKRVLNMDLKKKCYRKITAEKLKMKKYRPKMIISIQNTTSYGMMVDLNMMDCIPRKNIQYQSWLH